MLCDGFADDLVRVQGALRVDTMQAAACSIEIKSSGYSQ